MWTPINPDDIIIYQAFVASSVIIDITAEIKIETINIRKSYKLKLPDAVIAASALVNSFTLIADNDTDFKKIPGLKYFNPRQLL